MFEKPAESVLDTECEQSTGVIDKGVTDEDSWYGVLF